MYPGDFAEIRSKQSGKARLIMGKRKGSSEWEVQAIRYPKENWPAETAKQSCMDHEGMFERAVAVAQMTMSSEKSMTPDEMKKKASGMKKKAEEMMDSDDPVMKKKGQEMMRQANEMMASMHSVQEWDDGRDGPLPKDAAAILYTLEQQAKTYAKTLRGVEIFSTGTWNGDSYSESDLDAIVSAHASLGIIPPLKLGHTEGQKFFGQADGHPALGWAERLYRHGKKLLADFEGIPEALHGLIREKKYRKVSAEIYWDYKDSDGRTWPRVLRAVALLGADMPAVSNLQDLQTALLADQSRTVHAYGDTGAGQVHQHDFHTEGGSTGMPTEKEYQDKILALEDRLTAQGTAMEKANARVVAAELRVFSQGLDTLVREGKVLPAEVEGLKADFGAMGVEFRKYTVDGKDVEQTWGDRKLAELAKRPKLVEFKEKAQGGEGGVGAHDGGEKSVTELIDDVMRTRKCSYNEALGIVRETSPEVFKDYVLGKEAKQ